MERLSLFACSSPDQNICNLYSYLLPSGAAGQLNGLRADFFNLSFAINIEYLF